MELRKYRVPLTILLLSVVVLAMTIAYTQLNANPSKNPNAAFPTGIPYALGALSATQIGDQQYNTLSVSGAGTASMQADEATVVLGVQNEHESASEAVRLNAEMMTKVIAAIKDLGIPEDDMKTVSYSVYPVYSQTDYNKVIGYRVANMIEVKTTDIKLIGKVIDVASEQGANQIQGVSFGLSDKNQNELRRQAYLTALDDAEQKAELIAEKLKLNITGVLYVSESSYQPYQPYWDYRYANAPEAKTPTPIIQGKLSVSVSVQVIYSFE